MAASAAEHFVAASQRPAVTHFLLYLNDQTYLHADGERLAEELRRATAAGSTIKVVMAHENDQKHGGCDFSIFFDGRTPPDLQQSGIYNVSTSATLAANLLRLPVFPVASQFQRTILAQALAVALYSGRFWPVSVALVAMEIGAITAGSCSSGRSNSSFTTTSAIRTGAPEGASSGRVRSNGIKGTAITLSGVPMTSVQENQEQHIDALLSELSKSAHLNEQKALLCRSALMELVGVTVSMSCDNKAKLDERPISDLEA